MEKTIHVNRAQKIWAGGIVIVVVVVISPCKSSWAKKKLVIFPPATKRCFRILIVDFGKVDPA